jgi:hypothetical protein
MIRGAWFALVGILVVSFSLSADDKPVEKPVVKKDPAATDKLAADQPVKKPAADQPAKKPTADAPVKKPAADQPAKRPTADAPEKKPLTADDKAKLKKEGGQPSGGKLEKAAVAGNVLTLTIDGKDYDLPITVTRAQVKAGEQDGKQVILAVQLVNTAAGGKEQLRKEKPGADKPDAPKKPGADKPAANKKPAADKPDAPKKPAVDKPGVDKPGADAPKKPDEKPPVKTPEKKPE